MITIHKDSQVSATIDLFSTFLVHKNTLSTPQYLQKLATRLVEGQQQKHAGIAFITARFFKKLSLQEFFDTEFTLDNAQWCIAQEHGYENWENVIERDDKPSTEFENLLDAMLAGDIKKLKYALQAKPELINQQSHYPHKATLLHYTGSNGVEAYRQVVPENLANIIDYLLQAGANVKQKAAIYSGCTARELLETSKHPYEAGVIKAAQAVYERFANTPKTTRIS